MLPFVNSLPLGVIELKNPADLNFVNPLISRYIGNDSSSILSPVGIVAMEAHFRRSVGATRGDLSIPQTKQIETNHRKGIMATEPQKPCPIWPNHIATIDGSNNCKLVESARAGGRYTIPNTETDAAMT